ncbi:MAG: galactonate dehydratase [Candidatus Bathyarchaeia archaeon]
MKITGLKTFLVNYGGRNWIFVKLTTDEGIEGIGEAYNTVRDKATEASVHQFRHWLIGKDPRDVELHWQAMYRFPRFPLGTVDMGALSGLEHALWDILGKSLGVPVWRLLGGRCRDKIKVYTHAGGRTPEELAENVQVVVKRGFKAVKFGPQPWNYNVLGENAMVRESATRVKAVREAVGEDVDIALDVHGIVYNASTAIKLAQAVEPYKPLFFEEPFLYENVGPLLELKAHTSIPIATGERLFTRYGFRELLEKRAVDIVQPDPCVCGGIMECKRIAAMADTYYVWLAPHNPMSPVGTAVCAQIAASTPNFLILEYIPDDRPPRSEIVKEPLKLEDGYLKPPEKPGLGVELNEEALAKYPYKEVDRGSVFYEDGSVALT